MQHKWFNQSYQNFLMALIMPLNYTQYMTNTILVFASFLAYVFLTDMEVWVAQVSWGEIWLLLWSTGDVWGGGWTTVYEFYTCKIYQKRFHQGVSSWKAFQGKSQTLIGHIIYLHLFLSCCRREQIWCDLRYFSYT